MGSFLITIIILYQTALNCSCEGIGMIENIMDQIAFETGIDSIKVRLANISDDIPIPEMIEQHTEETDYYKRLEEVEEFNTNNRWKKKGISLTAMRFRLEYIQQYSSVVSIYHTDGTVSVTHSGIEMGQGINTKVAQVVAYAFDIPIQFVAVKPSSNHVTPNAFTTAGSMASDLCCYSTLKTCEILNERMKDVKNQMVNNNWPELIAAAYTAGVDLHASYMYRPNVDPIRSYLIYGVCISEVEVDMLTGNHIITRVDILEDVGESLSPLIDVGQVEGAFMMGVGYWTTENLKYNPNTGELLTNRTWNYKVPGAKDIPVDFRVYFRRNAPNPLGVLRAKATGEPPLTLSFSVAAALRYALTSARKDAGLNSKEWFILKYPLTSENILLASGTDPKDFILNKISTLQ